MQSRPIQFVLRADVASRRPRVSPRHRLALSAAQRPSLPVVLARSVALALLLALVALSALSDLARAQSASTTTSPAAEPSVGAALRRSADRHGLWGSIGLGRGSAGISCEACANETTRAYSLQGTIGLRVSPRFLVGAETFAWLDVIGGGVDRIARGTYLVARAYPFQSSRIFLNGGLGVASFQVNDGEVAFKTQSPSLSLAAGFDWAVGGLTISPSIAAITSTGGRLNSDRTGNAITENARLGLLRSSVALSWFR